MHFTLAFSLSSFRPKFSNFHSLWFPFWETELHLHKRKSKVQFSVLHSLCLYIADGRAEDYETIGSQHFPNLTLRLLMSYIYIYMERILLMFLDHTQRSSTVGRTPLDEWSARRRDLYLTTHDTQNRQLSMPPVGFETTISVGERPQTYAFRRRGHWDRQKSR